jgi:hypothetical protein
MFTLQDAAPGADTDEEAQVTEPSKTAVCAVQPTHEAPSTKRTTKNMGMAIRNELSDKWAFARPV